MEGDFIKINKWLLPLSWLYGLGVWFRNLLFDTGAIKSRSFDVPVISVGNITVGGSGKTPHVEYLIRLLHDKVKVAVLSRGYKRKSHGYQLARKETTMLEIGDEPYQMHKKFKDIHVAVDTNRCKGIETLMNSPETRDTQLVLLDDAYQHRYVKPGLNILLVDYHRLIIYDKLLPAGRLREPKEGKNRADIVIITKCPKDLKPMNFRVLQRAMALFPFQQLYFTTIDHSPLEPLFPEGKEAPKAEQLPNVLLVTGIASPEQMIKDLSGKCKNITPMRFSDHHLFTASDIEAINLAYRMMEKPAIVITTEKDATRLETMAGLADEVRKNTYVQPIRISFMLDEEQKFNNYITDYVRKHQRNSRMAESTHDNCTASGDSAGNRSRTIGFRNH